MKKSKNHLTRDKKKIIPVNIKNIEFKREDGLYYEVFFRLDNEDIFCILIEKEKYKYGIILLKKCGVKSFAKYLNKFAENRKILHNVEWEE